AVDPASVDEPLAADRVVDAGAHAADPGHVGAVAAGLGGAGPAPAGAVRGRDGRPRRIGPRPARAATPHRVLPVAVFRRRARRIIQRAPRPGPVPPARADRIPDRA